MELCIAFNYRAETVYCGDERCTPTPSISPSTCPQQSRMANPFTSPEPPPRGTAALGCAVSFVRHPDAAKDLSAFFVGAWRFAPAHSHTGAVGATLSGTFIASYPIPNRVASKCLTSILPHPSPDLRLLAKSDGVAHTSQSSKKARRLRSPSWTTNAGRSATAPRF